MFAILILGCGTETSVVDEPVVEPPEPVIEEPPPVLAQTAYFIDVAPPTITSGTVADGDSDVDHVPINQGGFRFDFDRPLKLYRVDLRLDGGKSLGWSPRGVVDHENIGQTVVIVPVAESQLLKFDTVYVIAMYVLDHACDRSSFQIRFWTKPG
jgi:hypothetical protein